MQDQIGAQAIFDLDEMRHLNAMQIMLKHTQAFGNGTDLTFPTNAEIQDHTNRTSHGQHLGEYIAIRPT